MRLIALLLFLLPTRWVRAIARLLGAHIHPSARVGFSWVDVRDLRLGKGARIGHFNIIRVSRLILRNNGTIGTLNWLSGAFSVVLRERAEIGARNVITRAAVASEIGPARLRIGCWSKVTAGHKLEVMRSITIGDHSILAGCGSQMWTHGYVHERTGRFRVDGAIVVGDHVYIGSSCILNPGVWIGDDISVGSQCCVSKDLLDPGLYVNQALRHIERSADDLREGLQPVEGAFLTEPVFTKAGRTRCRTAV